MLIPNYEVCVTIIYSLVLASSKVKFFDRFSEEGINDGTFMVF